MPDHVIALLRDHPDGTPIAGGEPTDAVVLVADVAGFTPMSEALARSGHHGIEEFGRDPEHLVRRDERADPHLRRQPRRVRGRRAHRGVRTACADATCRGAPGGAVRARHAGRHGPVPARADPGGALPPDDEGRARRRSVAADRHGRPGRPGRARAPRPGTAAGRRRRAPRARERDHRGGRTGRARRRARGARPARVAGAGLRRRVAPVPRPRRRPSTTARSPGWRPSSIPPSPSGCGRDGASSSTSSGRSRPCSSDCRRCLSRTGTRWRTCSASWPPRCA